MASLPGMDEPQTERTRYPAPEAVVRDLVFRGVGEATARGYDNRQAFAVLARLKKRDERVRESARAAGVRGDGPHSPGGIPERADALAGLERVLEHAAGDSAAVMLACGGSLYVFSGDELVRIARGLVRMLGGSTDDADGTGGGTGPAGVPGGGQGRTAERHPAGQGDGGVGPVGRPAPAGPPGRGDRGADPGG
jgi:hypothetical protein